MYLQSFYWSPYAVSPSFSILYCSHCTHEICIFNRWSPLSSFSVRFFLDLLTSPLIGRGDVTKEGWYFQENIERQSHCGLFNSARTCLTLWLFKGFFTKTTFRMHGFFSYPLFESSKFRQHSWIFGKEEYVLDWS